MAYFKFDEYEEKQARSQFWERDQKLGAIFHVGTDRDLIGFATFWTLCQ